MLLHMLCMKNYLLLLFNVISFADFFAFSFIHDCRIVSAFICEAFYHIISFTDGHPFGLPSVTYASWIMDDGHHIYFEWFVYEGIKFSIWFDNKYFSLKRMTWPFVLKAQLIKLWICHWQLLQAYIQSLNKRNMNLTLESHPIRAEFQLRRFIFMYGEWTNTNWIWSNSY